jgi:predicted phosphoribosyltransferase
MSLPFQNRSDAGRAVARKLEKYRGAGNVLVLGLPRGGVPVAFEIAEYLEAPLDVFLVRKLGVPGREELALGAIASGDVRVLNYDVVYRTGVTDSGIDAIAEYQQKELARREQAYREGRPGPEIEGKTVILVDDGLATGATMLAAVRALKKLHPARLVVAVPVSSPEACEHFRGEVDEIVCAETPRQFEAVGQWYRDFSQTTDEEVRQFLHRAPQHAG